LIIGGMTDFQDGQSIPAGSQESLPIKVLKYHDYLSKDVTLRLSSSRIVLRKSVFDEVGGLRSTTAATFHLDSLNLILKVATYGPCVVVQQPCTVAYRHHETNAIRSLEPIADGILVLARSEHQGQYPGGSKRRRQRSEGQVAVAMLMSDRHWFRVSPSKLGLKLPRRIAPMV